MQLISRQTKHLFIPATAKTHALWPDAKIVQHNGSRLVALPHNPRTQFQLRAAQIEAPAPILSYYDWAGGTPFDTQRKTAALLTSNRRAYVLSDMGTGKTRAALWSWDFLYEEGCAGKLLVVCPISTMRFTWLREISLTLPHRKAVVVYGSRRKRRELLAEEADIYIINHDGLRVVLEELRQRTDIDALVLDELAVYRNNSQRSKIMRGFVQRFAWAWGMTGRPMPHEVTDVWAQAKILTPQNVPRYFSHAQSELMYQVGPYKWLPKPGAVDTAYKWLQPAVRFSLDDVVELPLAITRSIDIEFSEHQARAYKRLANELCVMIEDKRVTAGNAGIALGKLLQIGVGYVYTTNPQYAVLDSTPRQEALLEIIEEAEHKLIVFAPWRHLITGLSALFDRNEIEHAVVHGDTKRREEIFGDFQNTPRYRVLLAHPGCIHHGLTLTAATTIVWYSPIPSLEVYEQANARIRRVGQKHKQQFIHLQASAVEKKIYGMLFKRQKLQDEFLDLIKQSTIADL